MSYPYNLNTRFITGRFDDAYEDSQGQVKVRPREGYVYVTPFHDKIKILDESVVVDLYELQRQRVPMVDGRFTVELPLTDQANMSPSGGWTYRFEFSWDDAVINLPITSDLPDVIDINNYFHMPEHPGVIIEQGLPGADGRGITSITAEGHLATVHYTDGTTSHFGLPEGVGGGVSSWEYEQKTPAKEWVINHNLNRNITACYVLSGTGVGAEQILVPHTITDRNTIVIHHGSSRTGKAILI